jgi:hypothetical protein
MGIIASFLESLLGLNLPIVPKTQEADGSPMPGTGRTITDVLVDEMAGDEAEQPAPSEDVMEPTQAEASTETDRRPPTEDEAQAQRGTKPAAVSRPPSSVEEDADNERQGDEG